MTPPPDGPDTITIPPDPKRRWRTGGSPHRLRWVVLGLIGVVVAGAGVGYALLTSSPTPGSLLIRDELNRQGQGLKRSMATYADKVPQARGSNVIRDQAYRPGQPEAKLDVYTPNVAVGETARAHPTIVWIHGGGWIAGDKADWSPYFELLAGHGFTVASVGYGLAPEHPYPRAVHQINEALGYVVRNAERLRVDPDRIILAGDSAGAQLASQAAAVITNPTFARELDLEPGIEARRLRGVLVHSGVYDAEPFTDQDISPGGTVGFGIATLMWAYAGTKDWDSKTFDEMSTIDHVTKAYPPTFITAGNDDQLTAGQSRPFAGKLRKLGVPVQTAFYPPDYRPKLPHEFQFYLDTHAAQDVLDRTVRWARDPGADRT